MKRRIRIITTAVSICLVFAVMCIGIYAAAQVSLTGQGGTLSFNSEHVQATVVVKNTEGKLLSVPDETGETYTYNQSGKADNTVTITGHSFTAVNETVSFTVAVTNGFAEGTSSNIKSVFTASVKGTNGFKVDITAADDAEGSYNAEGNTIAPAKTLTYTVTVTYTGAENVSANDTFSFSLTLTKA